MTLILDSKQNVIHLKILFSLLSFVFGNLDHPYIFALTFATSALWSDEFTKLPQASGCWVKA